jgi:hypothetical protein
MSDDRPPLEPGAWAALCVQYLEDRDGRALVRLPNGSKTTVASGALRPMIVEYHAPAQCAEPVDVVPGDIYEDCRRHPMLCIAHDGDEVSGISLLDGSQQRCLISSCGIVRLEIAGVIDAIDAAQRAAES